MEDETPRRLVRFSFGELPRGNGSASPHSFQTFFPGASWNPIPPLPLPFPLFSVLIFTLSGSQTRFPFPFSGKAPIFFFGKSAVAKGRADPINVNQHGTFSRRSLMFQGLRISKAQRHFSAEGFPQQFTESIWPVRAFPKKGRKPRTGKFFELLNHHRPTYGCSGHRGPSRKQRFGNRRKAWRRQFRRG